MNEPHRPGFGEDSHCASTLRPDQDGKGILTRKDGTIVRQSWRDDNQADSLSGAVYRLTDGLRGLATTRR